MYHNHCLISCYDLNELNEYGTLCYLMHIYHRPPLSLTPSITFSPICRRTDPSCHACSVPGGRHIATEPEVRIYKRKQESFFILFLVAFLVESVFSFFFS